MNFACDTIELIERYTSGFAEGLFTTLATPSLRVLSAIIIVYATFLMIDALLKGSVHFPTVVKVIFAACVIRWGMNFAVFRDWFLLPLKTVVDTLANDVVSYACTKLGLTMPGVGIKGLIDAFQQIVFKILTIATEVKDGSYILKGIAYLFSLICVFPYFISLGYLMFVIIGFSLCLATLSGLAPLWILLYFLPATRGMCYAALRLLVANALEIILVCATLVCLLVCINHSITEITRPEFQNESVVFLGAQCFVILLLGFVSLLAQQVAASMAGAIAGAPTTNKNSASILAGVSLLSATAMKYKPIITAGKYTGKGIGWLGRKGNVVPAHHGHAKQTPASGGGGATSASSNHSVNNTYQNAYDFNRWH